MGHKLEMIGDCASRDCILKTGDYKLLGIGFTWPPIVSRGTLNLKTSFVGRESDLRHHFAGDESEYSMVGGRYVFFSAG